MQLSQEHYVLVSVNEYGHTDEKAFLQITGLYHTMSLNMSAQELDALADVLTATANNLRRRQDDALNARIEETNKQAAA